MSESSRLNPLSVGRREVYGFCPPPSHIQTTYLLLNQGTYTLQQLLLKTYHRPPKEWNQQTEGPTSQPSLAKSWQLTDWRVIKDECSRPITTFESGGKGGVKKKKSRIMNFDMKFYGNCITWTKYVLRP